MERKTVNVVRLMEGDKNYIHNNRNGRKDNGMNYGYFNIHLSNEDFDRLQNNTCIAYNLDGEYVVFLSKKRG